MKPADEIKCLFKNSELGVNSEADERVFENVRQAQQQTTEKVPAMPEIWRVIMNSPFTKIAAAAIFTIAILTGVFMFERTSGVAWAIEQSIKAMSKYNAVLVEGSESFLDKDGKLKTRNGKTWAVANKNQTKVEKVRIEFEGVPTIITDGRQTWRYDAETNTVTKNLPYGTAEIWIGSRLLEQLKTFRESGLITKWKVTEGKDSVTGKQRIFLACAWLNKRYKGPRSIWLEIDAESKLLVGFKQWENANWKGPAQYVAERITHYESLPDELFEFEIPEGANVIEH
jgi:outer membrane lipoprotein-sorting protein